MLLMLGRLSFAMSRTHPLRPRQLLQVLDLLTTGTYLRSPAGSSAPTLKATTRRDLVTKLACHLSAEQSPCSCAAWHDSLS